MRKVSTQYRLLGLLGLFALIIFAFSFFGSIDVFAQGTPADTFGIETVDENIALGSEDIRVTIAKIIRAILGFLGLIAIGVVLYGGFLFLTSGGNEDRIATGKKTLINGVIGLVIIFSAFAIVQFVLSSLSDATGIGDGSTTSGTANCTDSAYAAANPGICFSGDFCLSYPSFCASSEFFFAKSITPSTPAGSTGMNNILIRVVFSRPLSASTNPATVLTVSNGVTSTPLEVAFLPGRYVVEARHTITTPACDGILPADETCLPLGNYSVSVNSNLVDATGKELQITVGSLSFPLNANFAVDAEIIDTEDPTIVDVKINGSSILDQPLALENSYPMEVTVDDDHGVGYVHVSIEEESGGTVLVDTFEGPSISSGSSVPYTLQIPIILGADIDPLERYLVTVTAFDIDHNSVVTTTSFVTVGSHCSNGILDGDETDIDVGGSCTFINGAFCEADWQCSSGRCVDNQCVAWPQILDVDPWEGAAGNWVTVAGNNFGDVEGQIEFGIEDTLSGTFTWVPAAIASCGGTNTWNDTWVIATVPEDIDLPQGTSTTIRITRSDEPTFQDTTIDDFGPIAGPNNGLFVKNNEVRPGLCSVATPGGDVEALPDTPVLAKGKNFGGTQGASQISFGGVQSSVDLWTDIQIDTSVPANMVPGIVGVAVEVDGKMSNGIPFTVSGDTENFVPIIESIDPVSTTPGSFMTIFGQRFGDVTGIVYLAPNQSATCADPGAEGCVAANATLPSFCGDTWKDSQIIVEVPLGTPNQQYFIIVRNGSGLQSASDQSIQINAGPPQPGICKLSPSTGPAPLPGDHAGLQVYGVNFSNTPRMFFWGPDAVDTDISTWLAIGSSDMSIITPDTQVSTTLPITPEGYSVQTGPVVLQSNSGAVSNRVRYEVNDCRITGTIPGYQCCSAGPDAGLLKPNSYVCAGETRDAGYVWRFTSGKIPNTPFVVEECNEVDWSSPGASIDFPSPTPWQGYTRGTQACLNATVAVRFSIPMEDISFNNNVLLFTCGTGDSPDCENERVDITSQADIILESNVLKVEQPPPNLEANTWYHIELLNGIQSQEVIEVLGQTTIVHEALQRTRPCSDESAYCFDFKTGSGLCTLLSAGIMPAQHTTRVLGPVLDPRFPIVQSVPLYYYLYGRGNQECTVLSVDGLGWLWKTDEPTSATVNVAPLITSSTSSGYTDSRATAVSRSHTAPVDVKIIAASSSFAFFPSSSLVIDLAEPQVVSFWPNCVAACVNSGIGVRFNRHMNIDDYSAGIKFYECSTETCESKTLLPMDIQNDQQTFFQLQAYPQNDLKPNTWYFVDLTTAIRSIETFDDMTGDPDLLGNPLKPFSWKFRTKDDASLCGVENVLLRPSSFVAHIIGQKTKFSSVPVSSPDECSPFGQELNPWDFGWEWDVQDTDVAVITNFENQGRARPYCTLSCLPAGSDIALGSDAPSICGDGLVETGEDCDIANSGEVPGVSCSLNCLRLGSDDTSCGDGVVDPFAGEECDIADPATQESCSTQCLHEGSSTTRPPSSATTTPWCGSGVVTPGEDCDISDSLTQEGCSNQCLNIGSNISQQWCNDHAADNYQDTIVGLRPECQQAISVCGNNIIEPGEECEIFSPTKLGVQGIPGSFVVTDASQFCSNSCLLQDICTLTGIPFAGPGVSVPGAHRCEPNQEGCNEDCTLQGASALYSNSSLCADGNIGIGEYAGCELPVSGAILGQNPVQVVTAVGEGTVDPITLSQTTTINATAKTTLDAGGVVVPIDSQTGSADYALQCGYVEFDESVGGQFNNCPNATDGVATNSCCFSRPQRIDEYPVDGAGLDLSTPNVCLNTYIAVTFGERINEATLNDNLIIASRHSLGFDCSATGEIDVSFDIERSLAYANVVQDESRGFFARIWQKIKNFIARLFGTEARASTFGFSDEGVWCSGSIVGSPKVVYDSDDPSATTTVSIFLDELLVADTVYGVWLRGGIGGIKDVRGVGISSPDTATRDDVWLFKTGSEVCKIDKVTVDPDQHVYTLPNTSHTFTALAENSKEQLIVPIVGQYDWAWSWGPSNHSVFTVPSSTDPLNDISSTDIQGKELGIVRAEIVEDIDTTDNQFGKTFSGVTQLTSIFCERPWPTRDYFPYEEGIAFGKLLNDDGYDFTNKVFTGGEIAPVDLGGNNVYFNFSMGYCADQGIAGEFGDDLPYLQPLVFTNAFQYDSGGSLIPVGDKSFTDDTLKKFIFFNDQNTDVIGIQIFTNPNRFSAREWYQNRFGTLGSFNSVTIAGYDAITDGDNYYINALNQGDSGDIFNNIYLFSINPDSSPSTNEVFESIIDSLDFNINISDFGVCSLGGDVNDPLLDPQVSCSTNFECLSVVESNGICANAKTKLFRDWDRLHDVQSAQEKIESYNNTNPTYPSLSAGTFVPGYTVNKWPSWGTLSSLVGGLPSDPVNQWTGCGQCELSGDFCTADDQCPGDEACQLADSSTCWLTDTQRYICPAVASVYEYSFDATINDYMIHVPLEYFDLSGNVVQEFVDKNHFTTDRWCVPEQTYSPFGSTCGDGIVNTGAGEECDPVGSTKFVSVLGDGTTCSAGEQGVATCTDTCTYTYSSCQSTTVCGNGVVEPGEICDAGSLNGTYGQCNNSCSGVHGQFCGNGELDRDSDDKPLEFCDMTSDGVCVYMTEAGDSVFAQVYMLLDRSGSMSSAASGGTRWETALAGLDTIAANFSDTFQVGLGVYPGSTGSLSDGTTFNDTNNICGPTELVSMGLYGSDIFSNVLSSVAPGGSTPTADAINYVFANRGSIFGSNAIAPRSVVLITDGAPGVGSVVKPHDCPLSPSADPEAAMVNTLSEISALFNEGILTYVIGFGTGITPAILNEMAEAGGTDNPNSIERYYFADSSSELVSAVTDILSCSSYNQFQSGSCSFSCQGFGGFCGDGVIQTEAEECDDGNNTAGDGCSQVCVIEEGLSSTPEEEIVGCGDGVVQTGESCDLGDQNGVACDPTYDESCSYCSLDCKNVLTVDPIAFCGNGVVDQIGENLWEACDVKSGGQVVDRLGNNNAHELSCPDEGTYSCSSDCRALTDTCINCIAVDTATETQPYAAFLNPLIGNASTFDWGDEEYVSLVRLTTFPFYASISRWFGFTKLARDNGGYKAEYEQNYLMVDSNFAPLINQSDNKTIIGSSMCKDTYKLFFSHRGLYRAVYGFTEELVNYKNWNFEDGIMLNGINPLGDIFDYPVNGTAVVENEYIVSPAVPEGSFRVVLKWTDEEDAGNTAFDLVVYNVDYAGAGSGDIANLFVAATQNKVCDAIQLTTAPDPNAGTLGLFAHEAYWWPLDSCFLSRSRDTVAFHPIANMDKTFIQSVTINAQSFVDKGYNDAYTIVVEAFPKSLGPGVSAPIANFKTRDIEVEIYEYHEGQVPQLSIYKPTHTFKIRDVAGTSSNPSARYWHVANLVRQGDEYILQQFSPTTDPSNPISTGSGSGSIETDWAQVLQNYSAL